MGRKIYIILLILSAISFLGAAISFIMDIPGIPGPLLVLGFIALAFGVRGFQAVKGFAYTIWIFTAVTASMFYPQFFTY